MSIRMGEKPAPHIRKGGAHWDHSVKVDAPSRDTRRHPYYGYKMPAAHKAGGKRMRAWAE